MASSYIQVPFGYRKVSKPIQFRTAKNNFENKLFDYIDFISDKNDPVVKNNLLNAIKNREDLQKYILATSDLGDELQTDINTITGGNERFNNAIVRRVLDLKSNDLFRNPQPISLLFNDVEKFHQQNPIIGKLATQINAVKKSSEEDLTKHQFLEGDINRIEDSVPLFEPTKTSQQPITSLVDSDQTIQIIPQEKEITDERQLSDRLEKLFPDIEKITKENKTADVIRF